MPEGHHLSVTALHLDTEQLTTTLWVQPVPRQLNSSPIKSISFQFGEKEVVGYCIKGHTEVLWWFFPCSLVQLHHTCYPMVHEPEWPQKQLLPERNLEGKRIGKKKQQQQPEKQGWMPAWLCPKCRLNYLIYHDFNEYKCIWTINLCQ